MNVDRMKQELTRLGTRELELENTRVQLEAAVDDAQQHAADLIISGGEPTDSVEIVRHAEIALTSLERAIQALRGRRTETLTLAVMSQLRATANWHRIAREWIFGDPPVTELGRAEAEFYATRGAATNAGSGAGSSSPDDRSAARP